MRIDIENADLAAPLRTIVDVIRAHDGFVAEDFIVRERGGEFSCAIGTRAGEPDRILIDYSPALMPPLFRIEWSDRGDQVQPLGGLEALSPPQRHLLEAWLSLVNLTGKLDRVRRSLPRLAITSWDLRHHLAAGGFTAMASPPTPSDARDLMFGWYSSPAPRAAGPTGPTRWFLIPLKHFVNHDPAGAGNPSGPGRVAVATSATSDATETFENYGNLDALQLLLMFGFVSANAPLVQSVPVTVHSPTLGQVTIVGRGFRSQRRTLHPMGGHSPTIRATPDGVDLSHVTILRDNRKVVASMLALAIRSQSEINKRRSSRASGATRAQAEAEQLLDNILAANQQYYRRLDELIAAAVTGSAEALVPVSAHRDTWPASVQVPRLPQTPHDEVHRMLAAVSQIQQRHLAEFWG